MGIEVVYNGSFKCYSVIFKTEKKKHSEKDLNRLKTNKNSSLNDKYKKDIENGAKMKNEKYEKSLTTTYAPTLPF